jgi:hypothetical protein
VHVQSDQEGRKLAERILRETYHHQSVEAWSEGEQVLTVRNDEVSAVPERL